MKKGIVLLFLLLMFSQGLFAQEKVARYISVDPGLGYQHIFYTQGSTDGRSAMGFGFSANWDYLSAGRFAFGLRLSYLYHNHREFHKYHNLDVSASTRMQIVPFNDFDSGVKLFLAAGAGADFVFRDDGDYGCYFLLHAGPGLFIRLSDKLNLHVAEDTEITFQKGSWVLRAVGKVGLAFSFGGEGGK